MENNAIEISHLSKSFKEIKAVDDLSFSVPTGQLFAFLGVNGAGKSTTISILCGQEKMDSGTVKVCGFDVEKNLNFTAKKLGVVFQNSVLDQSLSVQDNLRCRAALYGIHGKEFKKRLDSLCEMLEFKNILSRTVGKLSGGQRRRIDIARALLHSPEILILDEPTTGLDPQTRSLLWKVVQQLRVKEKMTVLLTTHYMEEAADADYVVIIDSGKISAEGTPRELKNKYTGDYITLYGADEEQIKRLNVPYNKDGEITRLSVKNTAEATQLIIKYPDIFEDYEVTKGKMDDVFLAVTGKKLSAEATLNEGGNKQ